MPALGRLCECRTAVLGDGDVRARLRAVETRRYRLSVVGVEANQPARADESGVLVIACDADPDKHVGNEFGRWKLGTPASTVEYESSVTTTGKCVRVVATSDHARAAGWSRLASGAFTRRSEPGSATRRRTAERAGAHRWLRLVRGTRRRQRTPRRASSYACNRRRGHGGR
jgi:hypothetical protein